ncbi:MAG: PIG-L deacetylase family protein [Chthoniobacterales bacterium]
MPTLDARARVLLFAPHPDDESLAAGVFLQHAIAAGADVRIVYGTAGEKNGWPQRLLERKVRIREADRCRWGARRQAEALAALRVLDIGPEQVEFLSLPDQGVTDLLLGDARETVRRLADTIITCEPTHLLVPSACDTHPDHSAMAVLLRLAFDTFLPRNHRIARLEYLVHGTSAAFARRALGLAQTESESAAKRRAISCHVTQVALSRRRFLAYAERPERFVFGEETGADLGDGPIQSVSRDRESVRLQVVFAIKPLREETSLYLVGHDNFGGLRRLRATLPGRTARLELIDCATGAIAGVGRYEGDAYRAEISLPASAFVASRAVHVKLDRRVWFFDEAGWLEIGALRPEPVAVPWRRELAVA